MNEVRITLTARLLNGYDLAQQFEAPTFLAAQAKALPFLQSLDARVKVKQVAEQWNGQAWVRYTPKPVTVPQEDIPYTRPTVPLKKVGGADQSRTPSKRELEARRTAKFDDIDMVSRRKPAAKPTPAKHSVAPKSAPAWLIIGPDKSVIVEAELPTTAATAVAMAISHFPHWSKERKSLEVTANPLPKDSINHQFCRERVYGFLD